MPLNVEQFGKALVASGLMTADELKALWSELPATERPKDGESFFRNKRVVDLVIEKMPVSISLGLWTTLLVYFISIPLGIAKAVRDGSRFDTATTFVVRNRGTPLPLY